MIRGVSLKCDCLTGQNGHFLSQIVMSWRPSLLFVQLTPILSQSLLQLLQGKPVSVSEGTVSTLVGLQSLISSHVPSLKLYAGKQSTSFDGFSRNAILFATFC